METTYGKAQRETPTARWTDDLLKRNRWGIVGFRWHQAGHAGNQLGRPMFSSGQQQADMMTIMMQTTFDYNEGKAGGNS